MSPNGACDGGNGPIVLRRTMRGIGTLAVQLGARGAGEFAARRAGTHPRPRESPSAPSQYVRMIEMTPFTAPCPRRWCPRMCQGPWILAVGGLTVTQAARVSHEDHIRPQSYY